MRKNIFVFILLLCSLFSQAQIEFYGMTYGPGAGNKGSIFKCTSSGNLTTLIKFNKENGAHPFGSLIKAGDGTIYGMTSGGGKFLHGSIFKYSPDGSLVVIVSFNKTDGSHPMGSLILASDGNLYGLTYKGGKFNKGTLFKCSTSGTLTTLINFKKKTIGSNPKGSLLQAFDGNLYGMTSKGGQSGCGTLFKCTESGQLITLVNFSGSNGLFPSGNLIQGPDSTIYGMTTNGGNGVFYYQNNPAYAMRNEGTLFKISTSGVLTTLVNFGPNGAEPNGSLCLASDGYLYGTTRLGGAANDGTIFKCSTAGNLTTLFNFSGRNGSYPCGNLTEASDGSLYGMTTWGGSYNGGTIFQCTVSGGLTTLVNLPRDNGSSFWGAAWGDLLEVKGKPEPEFFAKPPDWAPPYDHPEAVRYYYLPDIAVYYDIQRREFVYLEKDHWLFAPFLPDIYAGYDLSKGHVVILNKSTREPWVHHEQYALHYPKYYHKELYPGTEGKPHAYGFDENSGKPIFRPARSLEKK